MCQQKFIRLVNNQQQGYVLIVVLSIMVLLSLMIVATYTTTDSILKASSYDSDRKYAQSVAEQASNIASQEIAQQFSDPANDIFPPITNYHQVDYPIIFAELLEGGPKLITIDGQQWPQYFTNDCSGHGKYLEFCAPSTVINGKQYGGNLPSWSRPNVFNEFTGNHCKNAATIDNNKLPLAKASARNPCYIVEFLGINAERILRYRIIVIAWGKNSKTNVKIESTYEISYD